MGDAGDKKYGFYRRRSYVERPDVLAAARWEVNDPLRWTDVDRLDPQRDDLKIKPHLYNLDAVAYESLMVGFFTVWRGQPADRHKPNNVVLGYSRDGWHWSRPDRRAFCPVSDKQGDWNANNVQSAGGGFLVVGDELDSLSPDQRQAVRLLGFAGELRSQSGLRCRWRPWVFQ